MGILTSTYATDKSKEVEGVWIDVGVDGDTVARMRILRMGTSNKKFTKRYANLAKKFRLMRGDKQELERKALREAFIETCLLEWENIENINAAPEGQMKEEFMPLTIDNAKKLFTALPDLFDMVVGQAMDLETFQSEANEEAGKNLSPFSNTK